VAWGTSIAKINVKEATDCIGELASVDMEQGIQK